ncbi:MAG: hydroxyisourate hydrolase [Euzebyaceae bacterium]|jgi:5-hydroxyisourate hydrolase|nr:hydroxyisourate hydrolase [Euzebyaceae bacterium]
MSLSTHVLDTATGLPATGVAVMLERRTEQGTWQQIGGGETGEDGRILDLLEGAPTVSGQHRLTFDTGAYLGDEGFYPEVTVTFVVAAPWQHHHVPLLLSPYGYTTYRGS